MSEYEYEHDDRCEAEYETGAHAWTPCGCWASRSEVEGLLARLGAAEESARGNQFWHEHYKAQSEQGWAKVDEAEAALDAAWATALREQHRVFEVLALAADLEQERPSSNAWRGAYRNVAKRIRAAVGEAKP